MTYLVSKNRNSRAVGEAAGLRHVGFHERKNDIESGSGRNFICIVDRPDRVFVWGCLARSTIGFTVAAGGPNACLGNHRSASEYQGTPVTLFRLVLDTANPGTQAIFDDGQGVAEHSFRGWRPTSRFSPIQLRDGLWWREIGRYRK